MGIPKTEAHTDDQSGIRSFLGHGHLMNLSLYPLHLPGGTFVTAMAVTLIAWTGGE